MIGYLDLGGTCANYYADSDSTCPITSSPIYGYKIDSNGNIKTYSIRFYPVKVQEKMPWLFDFDPPHRTLIFHSPVYRKIAPKQATRKKRTLQYLKQPMSRAGFRRGQRR